jgi:glycine betaine/choline ABC-type transport system substrate-binding protein
VKLAGLSEFVDSAAALRAFQKAYGFTLKPDQLLVLSGGDTSATIKAEAEQTDGVVYGTDGGIGAAGHVVLDDDKGVQPVYAPTPIIRAGGQFLLPNLSTSRGALQSGVKVRRRLTPITMFREWQNPR